MKKMIATQLSSILILGSLAACQQQAAEQSKEDESSVGESTPNPSGVPEISELPPSVDPVGENWVNCSNVATFNAEIKKVSDRALACSFSSGESTVLDNMYLKDLKNPANNTGSYVHISEHFGSLHVTDRIKPLTVSFNDSDLRRDDPKNLFFTVKTSGTCTFDDFKLVMNEGRSNQIAYGGNLNYWTAPRNFTFKANVLNKNSECLSIDVDLTGTKKTLSAKGIAFYKEFPIAREGSDNIYTYEINGITWKIKENQNFSSCTSNPSNIVVNGGLNMGISTYTNNGVTKKQIASGAGMKISHYKFKPSAKFYNASYWADEMRDKVINLKDVHNFSCNGYRMDFTW
jgi:hypothetical protein